MASVNLSNELVSAVLGAPLCCLVAWWLLVPACRAVGLVDAPALPRKLQRAPVLLAGGPIVFGAALLFLGWRALLRTDAPTDGEAWVEVVTAWPQALALTLAFGVGLVDDLRRGGLHPGPKVLGQALAAAPLYWTTPGWLGLGVVLAAIAAMNVFNTFDNADRTAAPLAALAFALWSLPLSLLLAAFTLVNRTPDACADPRGSRTALYLGDSGSHLLGMALLVVPGAWVFLLVPALDLARVVLVRRAAGDSPFHGDRRHLAQRLADSGWSSGRVAGALLAISAPLLVGASWAHTTQLAWPLLVAALVTTLGFGLLVARIDARPT